MKNIFFTTIFLLFSFFLYSDKYDIFLDKIKDKSELEKIILLEKQIEADDDVRYSLLKAKTEIKIRDYIGAKNTLISIYQSNEQNTEITNLLGMVYFHLRDYNNSALFFKKTISINQNDNFAKYYLKISDPFYNQDELVEKKEIKEIDIDELIMLYEKMFSNEEIKKEFIYLLNEREVNIIDEQKYNFTTHFIVKVLSSEGANYFRDFSYSFNSYEFNAELIKAGTYTKDGNFKEVNQKNVITVDKNKTDVSMYSNRKYIAFPIPDVKEGSIIEVIIKFSSTKKNLIPKLFDNFLFSSSVDTLISRYTLNYPQDLKLNILEYGANIKKEESTNNKTHKIVYQLIKPEVFNLKNESQSIFNLSSQILVSAYQSWDEISKWYADLFEDSLRDTGFDIDKDIISSLNIDDKPVIEKIRAVYQYIQKHIHYIAVELEESAMKPHSPSEIYKNKFGDCKDQTLFMVYLLKYLGIEAYPVLVSTIDNGAVNEKVPSPLYFNHVITYIPIQDGISEHFFLDTTSSVTPFNNLPSLDQGVNVFVVKPDRSGFFLQTPVISPELNRIEEHYKSTVNMIGAGTIEYNEFFSGTYSEIVRYSFQNKTDEDIQKSFYDIQKKSFANLKNDDLKIEGAENQSGDVKVFLTTYEKNIGSVFYDGKIKLKYSVGDLVGFLNIPSEVKYDYRKDYLISYKKKLEYIFPGNYKIIDGTVKSLSKENEYIYLDFSASQESDNHLIFCFEFRFKERVVKKNDLSGLIKLLNEFSSSTNFELTLENNIDFDYVEFYEMLLKEYNFKEVYENYIRKLNDDRQYEQSLELCNRALSTFPEHIYFYLIKSSILFELEKFEEAEETLNSALSIDSNNLNTYYYLINLYKKQTDNAKLEKILDEANKLFKDNYSIISETISFYNRTEQYQKTINLLLNLIEKNKNNTGYYSDLGFVYSLTREFKKAEQAFVKSIELDKNNHLSLNNLAWLYCENNTKINEAIEYAQRACRLEPLNDSYLDTLAEAYFLDKQYDKAIDVINKAIKINPNYTYLSQQLDKINKAKEMMGKD